MENEGKKRALIIGVSHYKHADPLNFCSNDGNKMHELLKSIGYEVSEKNGLIGSVSWDMMRETLINFFNSDKIKSNDTLLFYYSGHGIPDIDGEVYLATSEIDPSIPYKRGFSFDELAKIMQRSPS